MADNSGRGVIMPISKRQREKKERELWVAGRVAEAMNSAEATDYRPELGPRPDRYPDAFLISKTGQFPKIDLDVVSLPIEDFTARADNQNVLQFVEELQQKLAPHPFHFSVHLLDKGKRYGVPADVAKELVSIIEQLMEEPLTSYPVEIDFGEAYEQYPSVAEYISHVSLIRLRNRGYGFVSAPLATWGPRDGTWLLDALQLKKNLYGRSANSQLVIAIDGSWLVDSEQIAAFRDSPEISSAPFAQVWLVTSFHGILRLK